MPDIENLKKRAKQYVRWHRSGHYTVAATIRELLPKFAKLDDRAVLAAPFSLADAQQLIARFHGFDTWQAMLKGLESMTADASPNFDNRWSAEPFVFVTDMTRAINFYTQKLGFDLAISYGDPAYFCQLRRSGAAINLRCVETPSPDPALRDRDELPSAAITLYAAKPVFLEFQVAGVDFYQTLRTEPWGSRTFIVRDPDGNLILFAGTS